MIVNVPTTASASIAVIPNENIIVSLLVMLSGSLRIFMSVVKSAFYSNTIHSNQYYKKGSNDPFDSY